MSTPLLDFTEIIEKRGYDTSKCRLVRHDRRGIENWLMGREAFGAFVSYQRAKPNPYLRAEIIFQFLPDQPLKGGLQSALFVGATRVLDSFPLNPTKDRLPRLYHPVVDYEYRERSDEVTVFDLEWLEDWSDYAERILVVWGPAASTRAWSQWASNRKPVVELRRQASEPGFPGFSHFAATLDELLLLPQSWRGALASVAGVYLLVCPDTGEQYVGSAYGEGGFWGRWSAYAADGHGGNILLRLRGRRKYAISILEIASPDMAPSEIIAREAAWKIKLGTRAHGLNAN